MVEVYCGIHLDMLHEITLNKIWNNYLGDLGFEPRSQGTMHKRLGHLSCMFQLLLRPNIIIILINQNICLKKNITRDFWKGPIMLQHIIIFFNEITGYLPADFIRRKFHRPFLKSPLGFKNPFQDHGWSRPCLLSSSILMICSNCTWKQNT